MNTTDAHRIMRRLSAAEGYLQLGMPGYALDEIDAIDDVGPFSPPRDLLRGEALKDLERYDEAIPALQEAARTVAPPHRRLAWDSLIECFRARGQADVADVLEHATHTPGAWQIELPEGEQMQIIVQVVPTDRDEWLAAGAIDEDTIDEEFPGPPTWWN